MGKGRREEGLGSKRHGENVELNKNNRKNAKLEPSEHLMKTLTASLFLCEFI